jgi:hypothetical protein
MLLKLTQQKNCLENRLEENRDMSENEIIECNKSLKTLQNNILKILHQI